MFVEEAMSRDPRSVSSETSVREVMRILVENDIRHLPVVDGVCLVGIVSVRDLPAVVATGVAYFGDPHQVEQVLDQPVSNVMTTDVIAVLPKTGLGAAIDLMLEHKVGALPVVDGADTALIGILSYSDALRVVRPSLRD
ncbi:MAG: CBS domain-containing protein [Myxococcales bacterium]